ncbi:hypothetical protein F2P56_035442 [Juglans regia]|uniref:Tf2-1-like SH3-like domain-containing protein n=1 Tax=Juglans regia TaxID=51240 RepID=A0A833WSN3_JUGRE|nr:hypothetical protein F2P56_035442 [Juglans regia]
MTPYEVLYGRRCRSPLYWDEVGERKLLEPKIIQQTTKKIDTVWARIKASQSRQKSYADKRHRQLEFEAGDKIGPVAYWVALPLAFSGVNKVFHVSTLRKYIHDPTHIIDHEPLQIHEDMTYIEEPVQILDRKEQVLRTRTIPLVKVQWKNNAISKASWEFEEEMRVKYPHLFEENFYSL